MAYGYVTPTNGFTVEAWFRRAAVPGTGRYEVVVSQYTQGNPAWSSDPKVNGRHFALGFSGTTGALYMNAYREGGTQVVNWSDAAPSGYENDNAWHQLAVRLASNKTSWTITLDGTTLATVTGSSAVDWNPGILTWGAIYAPHLGLFGSDLYGEGLAMCCATNAFLSDNRISEHYTAGSGGTVYYGDDEVERMTRIFDWTDTPITCRDTDDPLSSLQGIEVAGTNALDALLDTAEAAGGYVFADGQSWIQYHNKRHRYNRLAVFEFAESLGAAVEAGVDFVTDEDRIYNDVRGKRPYGGSYRMQDSISIDEFGRRTFEFSLPITSSEELRNTVGWLLSRYGREHLRISGVTLRAESSPLIERAATGGIEVGDHLVISELPNWAPVSSLELTVEGISLEADFVSRTWALSLNLSPADYDRVFQIGVSSLGSDDKVAL